MKIKININDVNFLMEKNYTILQSCLWIYRNKFKDSIFEIPRFCFHEKLSIAGNCRMCLVEVKNAPKPIAACAMPIMENMVIKTDTSLVKKAREGVLEFILANHPLDCPICDQGGECDLQDQSMIFGGDIGRFYEYKRAVEDKECGPFVKTVMTRCIHCTRCVRFLSEISGTNELGVLGRGSKMEIGTYLSKFINTEVSGNIIDLCPVGALTSKPYTFTARPWELIMKQTIDILDNIGADIRVDLRGTEIMRILPRYNEHINDMWISDITRFFYDSIKRQRLWIPMFKNKNSFFISCSWEIILKELWLFYYINKYILKRKLNSYAISGNYLDSDSIINLKNYSNYYNISVNNNLINKNMNYNVDFRSNYLLPYSREKLVNSDCIILVGTNLRFESPIYNLFLRKLVIKYNKLILTCTNSLNSTFFTKSLGISISQFLNLWKGRNLFLNLLSNYNNIFILLGNMLLKRSDNNMSLNLLNFIKNIKNNSVSIGVIQKDIGSIISSEVNLFMSKNKFSNKTYSSNNKINLVSDPMQFYHNLGDYSNILKFNYNQFIIFQGHHGSSEPWFKNSNLVLPSKLFLEQNSSYLSLEGINRFSKNVLVSQKFAKNDFKILILFYLNNYINKLKITKYSIGKYFHQSFCNLLIKKNYLDILNFLYVYLLIILKQVIMISIPYKNLLNVNNINILYKLLYKFINKYNYKIILFNNILKTINNKTNLFYNYPIFRKFYTNKNKAIYQLDSLKFIKKKNYFFKFYNIPYKNYVNNFYSYDIFSKLSINLSNASIEFKKKFTNYI